MPENHKGGVMPIRKKGGEMIEILLIILGGVVAFWAWNKYSRDMEELERRRKIWR